MTKKETYINALVNSMSMKDLKQYVENDMADFLYNCSESEVIKNEFLIKVEHTTDEQFYNNRGCICPLYRGDGNRYRIGL